MELKLIANTEEKLTLVKACLDAGVPTLAYSGFLLRTPDKVMDEARASLEAKRERGEWKSEFSDGTICLEDIQVEVLRMGKALTLVDTEDGNKRTKVTLELIESNWDKLSKQTRNLTNYLAENYDADDTDNLFQVLVFGEVVYG